MDKKRPSTKPYVLSVGALDATGCSGLIADWNVLRKFGTHPLVVASSVIIAGHDPEPVDAALLRRQLHTTLAAENIRTVKTGLLLTRDNMEVVANLLEEPAHGVTAVVVDLSVENEDELTVLSNAAVSLLKMRLLGLAKVAVAYLSEAERISGQPVRDIDGMKEAARALQMFGAEQVLIRADRVVDDEWLDVLYDGREHQFLFKKGPVPSRYRVRRDVFCSSLCAGIAEGLDARRAIEIAQEFEVTDAVNRLTLFTNKAVGTTHS